MKHVIDLMLGRAAFIGGLLWLSALAAMHLWPASWWLEIDSVRVADGIEGKPVLMHAERTIHRDFTGAWGVSVRSLTDHGSSVACAASAVSDYRIGADLPKYLRWAGGQTGAVKRCRPERTWCRQRGRFMAQASCQPRSCRQPVTPL